MSEKGLSGTAWGTRAGLSHGHVHAFLRRAEANDAADMKTSEVTALAIAAGLSPGWLATGHGEPEPSRDLEPAGDGYRVEYDARYPNLEIALRPLLNDLHAKTPARIRSTTFASNRDLTVLEWTRHILAEDERVRWEAEHGAVQGSITAEIAEHAAREHPELGPPPPKWPGGKRPKK